MAYSQAARKAQNCLLVTVQTCFVSDIPKVVSDYFAAIGRKGGSSTSDKKRKAVLRNLEAGRARRWPGKITCQRAPIEALIADTQKAQANESEK